jgi:hypothetical protein
LARLTPRQLHHPLDRQSPAGDHFFADLPVDRGLPPDACSIRCSSKRCKHPFKKIDRHYLLTDFALQLGYAAFGPAPLPVTRKRVAASLAKLTPPTLQHVQVDLPRATSAKDTPASSRPIAACLNSLVNCLRDKPMTLVEALGVGEGTVERAPDNYIFLLVAGIAVRRRPNQD